MKLPEEHYKILEACIEDFYGLCEILWILQEIYPGTPKSESRNAAEVALRKLLAIDWIRLFRRSGLGGEPIPLNTGEVDATLSDLRNWDQPTADSLQIVVGATPGGEHAYYSGKLGEAERS